MKRFEEWLRKIIREEILRREQELIEEIIKTVDKEFH
jgi:hypothetical protein